MFGAVAILGIIVFAQIMQFLSHYEFRRCVQRFEGNRNIRGFSCWDQFLAMAFAQLTYRESLRDIEVCLAAQRSKLYHCALSGPVRRSSLADANERRDWRIYADFAHTLIDIARPMYADTDLELDMRGTAYALDATTIDLCLSMFPWARFRKAKRAIKLHTMIEAHSSIPVFIDITHGKVHDVNVLETLIPEPGSFLIMDRAYLDFPRLYTLHQALAFFVIRAKSNLQFQRRYSYPVDKTSGLRSDETGFLTGPLTSALYPVLLRRVTYYSVEKEKRFIFLTNNFSVPPLTVASLSLFEKTPILSLFEDYDEQVQTTDSTNRLSLWEI